MPIKVMFDKVGFYHPAFGRLGRGKNEGKIYILPDEFGAIERVKIPLMDHTSKPPRKTGEKEITRYKHLPQSVQIIDDDAMAELIADAENENEDPPKPFKPKTATEEELAKVMEAGQKRVKDAQSANERTTGDAPKPKRKSRRAAPAQT